MPTLNTEKILERVQELKHESEEKDEVIRVQQGQIEELEGRIREIEERRGELELKIEELTDAALKAEELVERLSQVLA